MKIKHGWKAVEKNAITGDDIRALMEGRIPCIRIPEFLQPAWCKRVVARFLAMPSPPKTVVDYGDTKAHQIGLVLSSMLDDVESYFAASERSSRFVRRLYAGGEDPLLKLRSTLEAAMGYKTIALEEGGRPYQPDLIWNLAPGSRVSLHCDIPPTKGGLKVLRYPSLLGWNVYLSTPERGGALRVYERAGRPEDKVWVDGQFSLNRSVVDGAAFAEVQPQAGDLVLLNAAYYHEVTEISGTGHRVSCHSQVALNNEAREMIFWM